MKNDKVNADVFAKGLGVGFKERENTVIEDILSKHDRELNHPKWLAKRQLVMARDMFCCKECGYKYKLEVHHLYYSNGKSLWQYPTRSLITLCRKCHQKWHDTHEIEYRDKSWNKNKDYKSPVKTKKKTKLTKKLHVVNIKKRIKNIPAVVSPKQKEFLKWRNKRKRRLLKEAGYEKGGLNRMNKLTRDMTLDELRIYLSSQNQEKK